MQRRAAAIYFVFFVVVGAAAWAYIGVAEDTQRPEIEVSGTTFESGTNQSIDGTTYSAGEIADSEGTLSWTNESGVETASIANDSVIPFQDGEYRVAIPADPNATSFTLTEQLNVSAILAADPAVENQTATYNDTEQVVYRDNQSLRPLDEYLPEPEQVERSEGETMTYEDAEYTIDAVAPTTGIQLERSTTVQEEVDLAEGENVTLAGGGQYFAHFPSNSTAEVVSIEQYPQYSQTVAQQAYFLERLAGLWGIVIFAGIAALFLLAVAYLPVRG